MSNQNNVEYMNVEPNPATNLDPNVKRYLALARAANANRRAASLPPATVPPRPRNALVVPNYLGAAQAYQAAEAARPAQEQAAAEAAAEAARQAALKKRAGEIAAESLRGNPYQRKVSLNAESREKAKAEASGAGTTPAATPAPAAANGWFWGGRRTKTKGRKSKNRKTNRKVRRTRRDFRKNSK
jgi:hypothetical protein